MWGPTLVDSSNLSNQTRYIKDEPIFAGGIGITGMTWGTVFIRGTIHGHSAEAAGQVAKHLNDAVFAVLDQDFYEASPTFAKRIVHDGTVYFPECKCIFLAELYSPKQGYSTDAMSWVWRVDLNNTPPTTDRDEPLSLRTEVVLDNFFGHRFNSPNDIAITHDSIAYFTNGYYGYDSFNDTLKPEPSNGVYRWNMKTGDLRMILGAGGGPFTNPNGVALSPNDDHLYVANRGNTSDNPAGGRTIYKYHVNHKDGTAPVTGGHVFAYADSGFPDGVKVDCDGRVYGAITGCVQIWDATGKLLGIIKVANGDVAMNMQGVDSWMYISGRQQQGSYENEIEKICRDAAEDRRHQVPILFASIRSYYEVKADTKVRLLLNLSFAGSDFGFGKALEWEL
ncbi:hypothetical protein FDECE_927 [Fusarium decemcellulare]|nr:hypothetical protein FDECE_927 [Fusarium decemcellulare]